MRAKGVFILLFLLLFSACGKRVTNQQFFSRVKALEYGRNQNLEDWEKLYTAAPGPREKVLLLDAMSKTRAQTLLPFYLKVLKGDAPDSVKSLALFAIGQAENNSGRKILQQIAFDSLTLKQKKQYIFALSRCCRNEDRAFFEGILKTPSLRKEAFIALAYCARKYPDVGYYQQILNDSLMSSDAIPEKAYLASVVQDYKSLINQLTSIKDNDLAEKYLLKGFYRQYAKNPKMLQRKMVSDSLGKEIFVSLLKSTLRAQKPWVNQWYALRLAPVMPDSEITKLTAHFCSHANPHLKIAAYKSITALSDSLAAICLINGLEKEKKPYLRGIILAQLALLRPERAFRLIMQDFGSEDVIYRGALLEALANINTKTAVRTIRQYLQVQEPYLQLKAFEILKKMKRLHYRDVKKMFQNENMACKTAALEWYLKKKKIPKQAELLKLYQGYCKPADFELQRVVVRALRAQSAELDSAAVTILRNYQAHPVLTRTLAQAFPRNFKDVEQNEEYLNFLPQDLQPDSLSNIQENVLAVLETEYGEIRLKLLWQQAPLTCRNFVLLAKKHFYDGLIFHRVIPDFVIQGGDPEGTGWEARLI